MQIQGKKCFNDIRTVVGIQSFFSPQLPAHQTGDKVLYLLIMSAVFTISVEGTVGEKSEVRH